jgi:hypothetical protein
LFLRLFVGNDTTIQTEIYGWSKARVRNQFLWCGELGHIRGTSSGLEGLGDLGVGTLFSFSLTSHVLMKGHTGLIRIRPIDIHKEEKGDKYIKRAPPLAHGKSIDEDC